MHPLINGILFGSLLTILTGPIFFALIQAGIERGFRAGFAIGLGIWASDLFFILAVYHSISHIVAITEIEGFKLWMGIAGGIVLIIIGILTLISKPPDMEVYEKNKKNLSASYLVLLAKGFLINTINPFTFFFWISVMTAIVLKDNLNSTAASQFFFGIMFVIVTTDISKVWLAKYISNHLKPKHILWLRRISGGALLAFGVALMIRVLWEI